MIRWLSDRRRIQEIALAGGNSATQEQQLHAIQEMLRFLPRDGAFEFLEDRSRNSRDEVIRATALEALLLSETERGVRAVLLQCEIEWESRPPWSLWQDLGVPSHLRSMGVEAVHSLRNHGKLILKQMETEGYQSLESEVAGFESILEKIGTSQAIDARMRFRSSVSRHRKNNSARSPSSTSRPVRKLRLIPVVKALPPQRASASAEELAAVFGPIWKNAARERSIVETRLNDQDEALALKIKKLLLSASFHVSRDARAFKNLSAQLEELGNAIRANGQEHWFRIKRRVEFLSGEHFIGTSQYYSLMGEAPQISDNVERHVKTLPPGPDITIPIERAPPTIGVRQVVETKKEVGTSEPEKELVAKIVEPQIQQASSTPGPDSTNKRNNQNQVLVRTAIAAIIVGVLIAAFYVTGISETVVCQKLRAGLGSIDARNDLAWRYREGRGVPVDFSKAVILFGKSANSGSAKAQFDLGILYYYGLGTTENPDTARSWFERAAQQNYGPAVTMLGLMAMEDGQGSPQAVQQSSSTGFHSRAQHERNLQKAIGLWRQAVSLKDPFAEYLLGTAYLELASGFGEGLPEEISLAELREKENNLIRALFWFEKAKRDGVNPVGGMLQNVWGMVPDEALARVINKVDHNLAEGAEP